MHRTNDRYNCWEFKKCGREMNGKNAVELGVCPASTERKVDGIHGGKNAGRCCWAIAGTYCSGKVQGIFAQKILKCKTCDFYILVHKEEAKNIISPDRIIDQANNGYRS